MAFLPPIGISDFHRIRRERLTYVDKTSFVQRLLAIPSVAFLVPRPRRFGKTLNLNTARCFLEKRTKRVTTGTSDGERLAEGQSEPRTTSAEDFGPLFEGLSVWDDPAARVHFQRYPVVFLSFKDLKYRTWPECLAAITRMISEACVEHRALLDGLEGEEAQWFQALLSGKAEPGQLESALSLLSRLLAAHHGEQVVLLIDEYDTPIHAGFVSGYYDEVVAFFRNFLSAGLKDNPHLFKGVITGILRIGPQDASPQWGAAEGGAQENLFSGLNNLDVFGLSRDEMSTDFGFTEDEVRWLAAEADATDQLETMRAWYNGYHFGQATIYNPWSILKFLSTSPREPQAHWVMTSSNDLLREALRGGLNHPADIEALMEGGSVEREIDEAIVLRSLTDEALWSLLYHSGYVTALSHRTVGDQRLVTLALPNREVRFAYRSIFADYLRRQAPRRPAELVEALLHGEAEVFEDILGDVIAEVMSFHDFGKRPSERVYHAFLAGLLVTITATHEVRSNRESGLGRYDVALLPRAPGAPGVIMELKVPRQKETPEGALENAARQIVERQYATELRARGADPVYGYAVVFDGKQVQVRSVEV